MRAPSPTRVQKFGQVTIPLAIRQKLGIKDGDFVTFVETDGGVMIKPVQILVQSEGKSKPKKKKAG